MLEFLNLMQKKKRLLNEDILDKIHARFISVVTVSLFTILLVIEKSGSFIACSNIGTDFSKDTVEYYCLYHLFSQYHDLNANFSSCSSKYPTFNPEHCDFDRQPPDFR